MTDTAKPQKYSKVMPIEVEHEAEDVWQSTGLTPRQLLEQRNELRDALFALQMAFIKINGCFPLPYSSGHQEMTQAQSALAKCGKVGVK